MFNCSNINDVVLYNDVPEFQEFGPITYYEDLNFANPVYQNAKDNSTNETESVVLANFQQSTTFSSDPSGQLNNVLWMPNQGFSSIWMGLKNQPKWKQFMTALYTIVNMGLGQAGRDSTVFAGMQNQFFQNITGISDNLFAGTTAPS